MKTFVVLLNFTEQGIRNIHQSPQRAAAFTESVEKNGIKVREQLWVTGDHDGLLVLEAEDEQAVLRAMVSLARGGNVKPQTLRAFNQEEFESAVSNLG